MRKIDDRFYYHVYNRGVDKRKIFMDQFDCIRFLESMVFFNYVEPCNGLFELRKQFDLVGSKKTLLDIERPVGEKLVEIIAYGLPDNHYHLPLRELQPGGIVEYMKRLNGGYTKYFNKRHGRTGALLESTYKIKEFRGTEDILKLSAYVNGNAEIHHIASYLDWRWSSVHEYLETQPHHDICSTEFVLKEFGETLSEQRKNYKKFIEQEIKKSQERKRLLKELE